MERLKRLGRRVLFPGPVLTVLFVLAGFGSLIWVFAAGLENTPVGYVSYLLSAYALTLLCALVPGAVKKWKTFKNENHYLRRYFGDAGLRVTVSLYLSLAINFAYAVMQFYSGVQNRSVWFGALGVYYLLLGGMRFFLLRYARRRALGRDERAEWRVYRVCGWALLLMNSTLAAISSYITRQNRGFEHHYIVTIAMAAYTFYTFTLAIINLVRYRKYKSPVMSASKAINFIAAMVSMLSLETAMFASFGGDGDSALRQIIAVNTSIVVCAAVLVMAVYMVVRATRRLRGGGKGTTKTTGSVVE